MQRYYEDDDTRRRRRKVTSLFEDSRREHYDNWQCDEPRAPPWKVLPSYVKEEILSDRTSFPKLKYYLTFRRVKRPSMDSLFDYLNVLSPVAPSSLLARPPRPRRSIT